LCAASARQARREATQELAGIRSSSSLEGNRPVVTDAALPLSVISGRYLARGPDATFPGTLLTLSRGCTLPDKKLPILRLCAAHLFSQAFCFPASFWFLLRPARPKLVYRRRSIAKSFSTTPR